VAICSQIHTGGKQPPQPILSNGIWEKEYKSKWTVTDTYAGAAAASEGEL